MLVEATQLKDIEVELSDSAVKDIVLDRLREILDIPPGAYIGAGNLMVDVKLGCGQLAYYHHEIIREAYEEDIAAVLTIDRMVKEL